MTRVFKTTTGPTGLAALQAALDAAKRPCEQCGKSMQECTCPLHMLACACGYNPWEELATDSGSMPDEDSARVALIDHLTSHDRGLAGGAEWLVRRDHDYLYRESE
jgi:hypothetical protein